MKKTKKFLATFVFVLTIAAIFSTTAFASGGTASNFVLAGASYQSNGVVLTFTVNGTVNGLGNAKFVTTDKTYNFSCTQVSETTVICKLPKKAAGQSGTVTVGDFGVYVSTPAAKIPTISSYCYDVVSTIGPGAGWEKAGDHCQDTQAYYDEEIEWYDATNTYEDSSGIGGFWFNNEPWFPNGDNNYAGDWAFYLEVP